MGRNTCKLCLPLLAAMLLGAPAASAAPAPARPSAPAPAGSVPSARTSARPASAAAPARGVPGYAPAPRRGAPGILPPPPPPVHMPPPPPPRIVFVPGPAYSRIVASGLHDTRSPYHVAVCPECRALVDREALRHLDAWWVGERSRRMNAELNRHPYGTPPPPKPRKAQKPKKR